MSSTVYYKGRFVHWQRLDMVVDDAVIVENKAGEKLKPTARPQLVTYLGISKFCVGVLLFYGPKPWFKRFIDWPKRKR